MCLSNLGTFILQETFDGTVKLRLQANWDQGWLYNIYVQTNT